MSDHSHDLTERAVESVDAFVGRLLRVTVDRVSLPDGSETSREVVRHPGAAAVLPVTDRGEAILVRQFRYAAGEVLLEIPAGTLEHDEPAEECARRELAEETGFAARELIPLGAVFLAPGYSSELLHLFVARDLAPVAGANPDADENIEIVTLPLEEARRLVLAGNIRDAKTALAILAATVLPGGS